LACGLAQRHHPTISVKKCWGNCCIRASQPYHQDYHPDCTFHGLFSLRAGSLGAETLTGTHYTGHVQGVQSHLQHRHSTQPSVDLVLTELLTAMMAYFSLIFQRDADLLENRFS
jgi:hypothetical protein